MVIYLVYRLLIDDNAPEAAAKLLMGVLMYAMKAVDFHLPSFWIKESLKAATAAVDATPIQKLWPEKLVTLTPTCERASCKCEISWDLLSEVLSWKINNGPGVDGQSAYCQWVMYQLTPGKILKFWLFSFVGVKLTSLVQEATFIWDEPVLPCALLQQC